MKDWLIFSGVIFVFLSCNQVSEEKPVNDPEPKNKFQKPDTFQVNVVDSIPKPEEPELVLMPIQGDNRLFGYKDTLGNWVIKPEYQMVGEFSLKLAPVLLKGEWKIINKEGKIIHHLKKVKPVIIDNELSGEESVSPISERKLPIAFPNEKQGFLDLETGKLSRPFDEVMYFSCGFAAVRLGQLWGVIDRNMNDYIKPTFESIRAVSDFRAIVTQNDKECFYNIRTRKMVTEIKPFVHGFGFKEGMAFVTYTEDYSNYQLVDTTGKVVNKGPYQSVYNLGFNNGECEVMKGNKCLVIDKKGNKIRESKTGCVEGC